MAETTALTVGPLTTLERVPGLKQLVMLVALAVSVSVGVTAAFWAWEPGYSLLYSNISDRDAGEIVSVLAAGEIPYELDRKTGAILVPGDRIHDARLKLAGQGLPRGTGFGLEIMEGDNGFSTSQFMENARYHHALETELARTINNLRPVQNARVHLALPKNTVFLRQKRKPSASVLVYLFPGRTLEQTQVASIVHLVAASVPEMEAGSVTVIDQHGRLLTTPEGASGMAQNTRQFEYVRMIEDSYVERIVNLLTPMLGPNRVRATVSAELDFTVREETIEAYDPSRQAVRSEQISRETRTGASGPGGVPGALSNQPPPEPLPEAPADPAAPEVPGAEEATQTETAPPAPMSETRRSTRNFELDRTLSRTVQPTGVVNRLSVAVLVDNKQITNEDGELVSEALSTTELDEVTRLVRDAVGFDEERGDSVSVSNVSFFEEVMPEIEEPGMFDSPAVRDVIRQVLWAVLLVALGLGIIRPIIRTLSMGLTGAGVAGSPAAAGAISMARGPAGGGAMTPAMASAMEAPPQAPLSFDDRVNVARQLAERNPERVAQIVRGWVQSDE